MSLFEPYLFFNGNCAEAMHFYQQTLGGKLDLIPVAGSPSEEQMPPGSGNLILHARLAIGGEALMASDWIAEEPYPGIGGVSISMHYLDLAEGQRIFDALAAGGKVHMPFSKTFWAEGFGMLTDRYGAGWMVGGGAEMQGPEEQ